MGKFKQLLIEIRFDQAGLRFFVNIQPMGCGGVQKNGETIFLNTTLQG
jgi:hypothetical protein